jgi:hypothetical protein
MDLEQDITNGHPSRKGEGIKSHNAEALTNKKRVHDRKQTNIVIVLEEAFLFS